MGKYGVAISHLDLGIELEIMFCHFEEHLDVPTFSVYPDHLVVGQREIGAQQRLTLGAALTASDENELSSLAFPNSHQHGTLDLASAPTFPKLPMNLGQGEHSEPVEEPAAVMVMDPGKKLDAPGTIPVINGCVHYDHFPYSGKVQKRWDLERLDP
jgi:hypothetical protein